MKDHEIIAKIGALLDGADAPTRASVEAWLRARLGAPTPAPAVTLAPALSKPVPSTPVPLPQVIPYQPPAPGPNPTGVPWWPYRHGMPWWARPFETICTDGTLRPGDSVIDGLGRIAGTVCAVKDATEDTARALFTIDDNGIRIEAASIGLPS